MLPKSEIKRIIEAVLMAADKPLSIAYLCHMLESQTKVDTMDVQNIINELTTEYNERGIELKEVASGYRFQVGVDLAPWVSKLWQEEPQRYSRALLEILALIAYKQPITRAEIESVRGVAVSTNIMRTLMEREWIKIAGHKNVPGKPALYITTNKFLDYFDLKSIKELPVLDDLKDLDKIAEQLQLSFTK
jgi:segregation and condensation protein B